jgi:hypothetical protein
VDEGVDERTLFHFAGVLFVPMNTVFCNVFADPYEPSSHTDD